MDTSFSTAKDLCLPKADQHPQILHRRVSHLSCNYPLSKPFALQARHNCPLKNSRDTASKPFKSWLWSSNGKKPTSNKLDKSPVGDVSKWAPFLLYRVLLLVGIGLGTRAPAIAAPPTSEVAIQKEVKKTTQNTAENRDVKSERAENVENSTAEKSLQADAESKGIACLGESFWEELDLSKGSIFTILKGILEGDPTNLDALACLAKNLVDSDDAPHALTVIEKLELLDPDEMEWKYLKGFTYDINGQFQQAKTIYEGILKLEPLSSKAIQGLMMAMDELGEIDEMIEVVDRTMTKARAENNILEARNIAMLVGQFYMMKGYLRDALDHYQEMLEEDKKDFRPYLCQGIIYSALGEKAKAEQQFKTYEKLCPKDYPERQYLDALMQKARQEGQKKFEEKQKEKYVRIPKAEKQIAVDK
ncbi:hypothetical protein GOP47_0020215 [Adiantum capillus-veneris]|uniref:Uncharacterized protein n=1 Tax=Adiantum capillus-veneris TaxID=13818 RepID=A0A9D4UD04_ADICA|nr:hypothetical protein GOP47_0019494 [Adiantum capillus-veneris]KAI5065520.1 hypothetical protein GOP47_0020215 [Adiantum capillus-veneris]